MNNNASAPYIIKEVIKIKEEKICAECLHLCFVVNSVIFILCKCNFFIYYLHRNEIIFFKYFSSDKSNEFNSSLSISRIAKHSPFIISGTTISERDKELQAICPGKSHRKLLIPPFLTFPQILS